MSSGNVSRNKDLSKVAFNLGLLGDLGFEARVEVFVDREDLY